jgi:hypothetical protein
LISAQKRDTRAILLKTTLVHVSYIQNTQIRGETISKVFRKVDTFWTYQWDLTSLQKSSQEELIDYKTRRQEKMRATRGMQNNSGAFMRRRSMAIENNEL